MRIPGSRTAKSFLNYLISKPPPSDWKHFSRLYIKSENSNWVLDSIKEEMEMVSNSIGIQLVKENFAPKLKNQCVFYTSKYEALKNLDFKKNKIAFPMYHGNPDLNAEAKFHYEKIKKNHKNIDRIQVSNSLMKEIILETGIDKDKVFQIPISIDIDKFAFSTSVEEKINKKNIIGINPNSFLIGSFQKDGQGWGPGNKPKLIKGPDIFLEVIKRLKNKYPQVEVLLTGPARGFVKNGLKKLNVRYYHFDLKNFSDISTYYRCLNAYLVTSREEGGPRAILESMASGVPIVTTKVGQAADLVKNESNGWITEVGDIDSLVFWVERIINNEYSSKKILTTARQVALKNSYSSQEVLWRNFMQGFIEK